MGIYNSLKEKLLSNLLVWWDVYGAHLHDLDNSLFIDMFYLRNVKFVIIKGIGYPGSD